MSDRALKIILFIIALNIECIFTQRCNFDATICQKNSYCDQVTKLCKCKENFYEKNCTKEIGNLQNMIKGINSEDFLKMLLITIFVWVSSLILGLVMIFLFFYKNENKSRRYNSKPNEDKTLKSKSNINIEITELQNQQPSQNLFNNIILLDLQQKEYEDLKDFVTNLEPDLEEYDNNIIKTIFSNIKNYFVYNNKQSKFIIEKIYEEINSLFVYIKNNKSNFENFDLEAYEENLNDIKNLESELNDNQNIQIELEIKN